MPTYRFRNNETGEEFDKWMYMAEREPFLAENPHITQVPTILNAVSGIGTGEKLPGGFRDNMKRIQEAHPRANLSRFT